MIFLQDNYAIGATILVIFIIGLSIFQGMKKGFVSSVIGLVRLLIALACASWLARPFAMVFPFLQSVSDPALITFLPFIKYHGSLLLWWIILFIVIYVLTGLVGRIFKNINDIPVLGSINKGLGALLGVLVGFIKCYILLMVLCSPLFSNSKPIIEKSALLYVQKTASWMGQYSSLLEEAQIGQLLSSPNQLQEHDLSYLDEKLSEFGLSQQQIIDFLEGLK